MKGKMKAQVFYGPQDLRYEEIDIPQVGPGEVLVKIKSALTCGSGLKTYRRGHPTMIKEGSVLGHEYAGDIVEVGDSVDNFKIGDSVVAVNTALCYRCYYCKLERYSMCENIVYNNGGYTQYIKIPANILKINTYKIPDGIDYRHVALLEPLAKLKGAKIISSDLSDERLKYAKDFGADYTINVSEVDDQVKYK